MFRMNCRGKSRSVDQSFHLNNPFADLDIISRVTTSHSNTQTPRDSTSSTPHSETPQSASPVRQQHLSSTSSAASSAASSGTAGGATVSKKQETITYTVKENDTITSVSASFDITPSELIKTNRLSTRNIFPGQVLRIPPKSNLITPNNSPVKTQQHGQQGNNGRTGDGGVTGTSSSGGNYSKSESSRKFIKINVKHITDGNVRVSFSYQV